MWPRHSSLLLQHRSHLQFQILDSGASLLNLTVSAAMTFYGCVHESHSVCFSTGEFCFGKSVTLHSSELDAVFEAYLRVLNLKQLVILHLK